MLNVASRLQPTGAVESIRFSKIRHTAARISLPFAIFAGFAGAKTVQEIVYPDVAISQEATPACGTVLVSGSDWLGGAGVDVRSNGQYQTSGSSCEGETEKYSLEATPPQYGFGWQCVELVNRLYASKGWYPKLYLGPETNYAAKHLFTYASQGKYDGLTAHANGDGYKPSPGDMIVHNNGSYGHVAVVDRIDGSTLYAVEQNNRDASGNTTGKTTYSYNAQTGAISKVNTTISGYIHAEKNNLPGSTPTPGANGLVPYGQIADGQEFKSQEGHVYTRVGGAAFHIKHINNWTAADTTKWGNAPVGPVSTTEIHKFEAGVNASGQREVGAHPPRVGTAVFEDGSTQQWYFVNGGGAFPINTGEIDDLGVRNKAYRIPANGRLMDFDYGPVAISNRTRYRLAGTATVRLLAQRPTGVYDAFRIGGDTTLSCLELTEGGSTVILPQKAEPYLPNTVQTNSNPGCQFPSHWVLKGLGGQEQWHIAGDGRSTNYTRHYYPSQLGLELFTSGVPDYRTLRSVDAVNSVVRGADMTIPTTKPFRGRSSNQVFYYENGQLRLVPSPDTLNCLGNPPVTVLGDSTISGMPQGAWKTCNYEGRIIYRPDGRQYFIMNGKKQAVGNTAISACIVARRGTGTPIATSDSTVNSYVDDSRIAWCNYEGQPGLNFVRESSSPTVWLVAANGLKRHVGTLCVSDPYTTPRTMFRVQGGPNGETAGHQQGADWFANGTACAALPG